jgi:hypothetical protein
MHDCGRALPDVRVAAGTDAPSHTKDARDTDLGVLTDACAEAGTGVTARTDAFASACADAQVSSTSAVVRRSARAHASGGADIGKCTRFFPHLLLRGTRVRASTGASRRQVSCLVPSRLNPAGYKPSPCDDAAIQPAIHDNMTFIASPASSPLVTSVTQLWLN